MINIEEFLNKTNMLHSFCKFCMDQTFNNLNKHMIHSDRWSIVFDWVHDGKFDNIELPENIETDLTEYWETKICHIRREF